MLAQHHEICPSSRPAVRTLDTTRPILDPTPSPWRPPQRRYPVAYLYDDTDEVLDHHDMERRLSALVTAMTEARPDRRPRTARIAPVWTYFGQFVMHDVVAHADASGRQDTQLTAAPLRRRPRSQVRTTVTNRRSGRLGLDSLYGDPADPLSRRLRAGSKMRLGAAMPCGQCTERSSDNDFDLPRFGMFYHDGVLDFDQVRELLGAVERHDPVWRRRACIGDARNDEHLILAQLHVALLRFHNEVVESLRSESGHGDDDQIFAEARRLVCWTYQWLIVNDYLPSVCSAPVWQQVCADAAPLYARFHERQRRGDGALTVPLEFSAAAGRFGYAMRRDFYDFNRYHGRFGVNVGEAAATTERAALQTDLLALNGSAAPAFGDPRQETLPRHWLIDWERFVHACPEFRDRAALALNTELASALRQGSNPAQTTLRYGVAVNLPYAQTLIERLRQDDPGVGGPLSRAELADGHAGSAVVEQRFLDETPLWYYVLREAEVREQGQRLGPLGSRLLAETMMGLIVQDPQSYWHRPGSGQDGRWCPFDSVKPRGRTIYTLADLLCAAGVLT